MMNFVTEDGNLVCFAKQMIPDVKDNKHIPGPEYLFVIVQIKGSRDKFEKALKNERDIRYYAEKYPEAYKVYLEGEEAAETGTPLEELAGISVDLANRYKILGIRSIEDLAEAGDNVIQNLGHEAHAFRKAAKEKLEYEELKAMKELLRERQNNASDRPAGDGHDRSGEAEQPRRRGRPRSKKNAGDSESSGPRTSEA